MPKRTYERDANKIDNANDVEEVVSDKRQNWRANAATARRRQRRYKKRIVNELGHISQVNDLDVDD